MGGVKGKRTVTAERISMHLVHIIRRERIAKGHTISEFAKLLGMTPHVIHHQEDTLDKTSLPKFLQMAWALDTNPADMLQEALDMEDADK